MSIVLMFFWSKSITTFRAFTSLAERSRRIWFMYSEILRKQGTKTEKFKYDSVKLQSDLSFSTWVKYVKKADSRAAEWSASNRQPSSRDSSGPHVHQVGLSLNDVAFISYVTVNLRLRTNSPGNGMDIL